MFNLDIPYLIADGYSLNIGDTHSAGNLLLSTNNIIFFEVSEYKKCTTLDLAARLRAENGQSGNVIRIFMIAKDREIKKL